MRKWMAVLTALVLFMGCTAADAAAYTVDEKFWGQAENQAVTGVLGFSVMGDATAENAAWFQTMKQVLPETEINFMVTLYSKQPRGAVIQIAAADGSEKNVEILFDDEKLAIGSDALAGEGVYYLLDEQALKPDDSRIPGILDVLRLLETADEEWQTRAQVQLGYYQTLLSVWMNDYAGAAMGRADDVLYSELSCTIPADAVKEQVKNMLHTFYQDTQTLQLLGEVLNGTGGEIYLNPAMESVFAALVDSTVLTGDLQVLRRFDSHGALLLDSISLPLSDVELPVFPGVKWQRVSLEMSGQGDFSFSLLGAKEEKVHFSLNKQEEGKASGQAVMDMPGEDGVMQHTGYAYEWNWQAMEETYTLQTDLCERLMQGTLILMPDENTAAPGQKISLDVRFTSQSRSRSPAKLEANLVWEDVQGDAKLAVILTAQTSAPVSVKDIKELENTVLFHTLPADEREAMLKTLLLLPMDQAVTLPE